MNIVIFCFLSVIEIRQYSLYSEQEEKRKEKKANRKDARKRVNMLPEFSEGDCILDAVDMPYSERQVSVVLCSLI